MNKLFIAIAATLLALLLIVSEGCTSIRGADQALNTGLVYFYGIATAAAIPPPSTSSSNGNGAIVAEYNTGTKRLRFTFISTFYGSEVITIAHFHGPAAVGVSAPVRVSIIGTPLSPAQSQGSFSGNIELTAEQESELLAGNWYLQVHTNQNGPGALRAQMVPQTGGSYVTYSLATTAGAVSGQASSSTGSGFFVGQYNRTTNEMRYAFQWGLGSGELATLAHFHGPAAVGVSAEVRIGLLGPPTTPTSPNTQQGFYNGSTTLTDNFETELLANNWYFQLHSNNNGPGALRGQMVAF